MSQNQIRGGQIRSGTISNSQVAENAEIALSKIAGGTQLNNRVTDLESDAFVTREVPSGSVNGSNVTFTLANTPVAGSEQVYLNGLLQDPGAGNSYTIAGGVITFLSAPLSGDEIHVSYATGNYLVAPGGSGTSSQKQVLATDGVTTQFSLNYQVALSSSILVVSDGVVQEPDVSYSISNDGTNVIFSYAPLSSERIYIVYLYRQL